MVIQQLVAILVFLQDKMNTCPSTPPSYMLVVTSNGKATLENSLTVSYKLKIKPRKGGSGRSFTFHAKMGTIMDRNSMNLKEEEDIKKRCQEIHRTIQKDLNKPDNHDGVITHLQPDILECEVKGAIGSISANKASGGDGITAELFQILKDDAVKVLPSIGQQIWKTQQWLQDWKRSVFIPILKKGHAKEFSNYCTISHANKVMLKILQARLQQYVN